MLENKIKHEVDKIYDEMVSWRRTLHQNPELSFKEYETSEFIFNKLNEFGVDKIERLSETAVVALINGAKGDGKCIAIRADIDALPVEEKTDYEFASKNPNKMHACGHDGHTSMLLGTSKILTENRDLFKGSVKVIFQHGEELFPGGAVSLVEQGVMENPKVDAIICAHIVPDKDSGAIRIKSGDVSIGCDLVNVTITGQSGHGSRPHEGKDAITAASQYILAIQQIVSRYTNPKEQVVLSVGTLKAGTAVNIIADKAELSLNLRTFDLKTLEIAKQKLFDIAKGLEIATGCKFDLDYVVGYQGVRNNQNIVDLVAESTKKYLGEDAVQIGDFDLGSDDFSYYMNATNTPGAYYFLLSGYETESPYPNHHGRFTWKEEAMKTGVVSYLASALEFLNN